MVEIPRPYNEGYSLFLGLETGVGFPKVHDVVHTEIPGEEIPAGERIVPQPGDILHLQAGPLPPSCQFARLDELAVIMGAHGQEAENVLGPDDGIEK